MIRRRCRIATSLNLGVVLGTYSLGDYFKGSGLLTVLIFGVTLANLPRTPHMTRQGARLLAFHAEFSFLVRSFFFVLLGIVAQNLSAGTTSCPSSGFWPPCCWRDLLPCKAAAGWSAMSSGGHRAAFLDAATRVGHGGTGAGNCQ